jgi:hypothetical protein
MPFGHHERSQGFRIYEILRSLRSIRMTDVGLRFLGLVASRVNLLTLQKARQVF